MPLSRRQWLIVGLTGLAATTKLGNAFAAGAAGATDEQQRLMRSRKSERYDASFAGTKLKGGGARIHVAASLEEVEKTVTDYRHYSKIISRFDKARVVGRSGGTTDVYLQAPILKGAAKIWAVLRFSEAKTEGEVRVIRAAMVKGNVKRMDARWELRRIDAGNTQLNMEMLILPDLPAPASLITGESRYASDVAVTGARDHTELRRSKS